MTIVHSFYAFLFMAVVGGNEPGTPNTDDAFVECLQGLGEFLYEQSSERASKKAQLPDMPNCRVDKAASAIRSVVRNAVTNFKDDIAELTSQERALCRQRWITSWAESAQAVWKKKDWSDVEYVDARRPYEELDTLEQELFVRAEIEREMVYRNREHEEPPDGPNCQFAWTNSLLAREENLAFFKQHNLFEKFENGELSSKVFPEFWLIIQHADLHPDFQENALNVIERHGQGFPKVLIESLRNRVEMHRQRRSKDR